MFNTMNIPLLAKREKETREETFLRIMDTFMGEYPVEKMELGQWVMTCDYKKYIPCAWLEDEEGNILGYFICNKVGDILRRTTQI